MHLTPQHWLQQTLSDVDGMGFNLLPWLPENCRRVAVLFAPAGPPPALAAGPQAGLSPHELPDFLLHTQAQSELVNSGLYLVLHLYEQGFAELMALNYSRASRERVSPAMGGARQHSPELHMRLFLRRAIS